MAVNRDNDNTQGTSGVFGNSFNQTSVRPEVATDTQTFASPDTAQRVQGLRGVSRLNSLRTGMGRRRPQADLEAMRLAFEESLKQFRSSTNVPGAADSRVVLIDRTRIQKKADLLVAVLPVQIGGQIKAAVHTLLVADGNDHYDPIRLNVGQRQLQYTTVIGDVYNKDLWGQIVQIVSETAGAAIDAYDAGHQTIPAETDIKDKDVVHNIAFFASEALARTALNQIVGTTEDVVSLSDLDTNSVATAAITFQGNNERTPAQLPLRADMRVNLRYSSMQRTGESQLDKVFDNDSAIPLGSAAAFVDLSYQAPAPQQGLVYNQQPSTKYYWANIVLTKLDTDQDFITPELQMLALVGSTLMARNLNWARTWSQSVRGLSRSMHDIGSIGYELPGADGQPAGVAIDTTGSSFDDNALARLVTTTIHDKPIIQLDVEESGEMSWINSTLLDAANGSAEARQSIVQTLDNLTNGNFSQLWKGGDLILDSGNRIHLGYYNSNDEEDSRRDIRELDYLAVLTRYGAEDPQMVAKWQATYDDTGTDAAIRLAEREELIRKILGATVTITGYARRVILTPELLDTLVEAAAMAGLVIRPDNIQTAFGHAPVRGRQDFGSLAYGGNAGNVGRNVFSFGQSATAGRSFNQPYTGRGGWRR